jgi:hypothetical protein
VPKHKLQLVYPIPKHIEHVVCFLPLQSVHFIVCSSMQVKQTASPSIFCAKSQAVNTLNNIVETIINASIFNPFLAIFPSPYMFFSPTHT